MHKVVSCPLFPQKLIFQNVFVNSFFLRGEQTVKLTVTKGGPLPFAWDILSPQTQYGSIPFTKYPEDIPDYVKQSFPEGYTWERIMKFEDGAVSVSYTHLTLPTNREV